LGANLSRRHEFGQAVDFDADSHAFGRPSQISDVSDARLVFADEKDHQFGMNTGIAQRIGTREQFRAQFGGERFSVEYLGGHASRFLPTKEASLERVRREIVLEARFGAGEFERAYESFVATYNVAPHVARCSPDVLDRFCRLFELGDEAARQREVRFRNVPVFAGILPSGTVVFEGEVDEDRMGDW
jgi:hypothetical protein